MSEISFVTEGRVDRSLQWCSGGGTRGVAGDVILQLCKLRVLAALPLKKNDPGISGAISHDGLTISGRLDALEKPHGRLATLPAP
jgi:hypothetical protein